RVDALAGDDNIRAEGTFDTLVYLIGGDGNDRILGSDSGDVIRGGNGSDVLVGNGGNDEIHGDAGDDNLYGTNGDDTLIGGTGKDSLKGGNDDDELFALNPDVNWISTLLNGQQNGTGAAVDSDLMLTLVPPSSGNFLIAAPPQTPSLQAVQNETINGESGNDQLTGTDGADQLIGGPGNDIILHTLGDDVVSGGTGNDRYQFVFTDAKETINVGLNSAGKITIARDVRGQSDPVLMQIYDPQISTGIERLGIDARGGDDHLSFDFGNNEILDLHVDGGAGDDKIDFVNVLGDAIVLGGSGDRDEFITHAGGDAVNVSYYWGSIYGRGEYYLDEFELLTLHGDERDNLLNANLFAGYTQVFGNDGDDVIIAGGETGFYAGGDGDDRFIVNVQYNASASPSLVRRFEGNEYDGDVSYSIYMGFEDLELVGNYRANNIDGGTTRMPILIRGLSGNDTLKGGQGDDTIQGDTGNDTLRGGDGNDKIYGGDGIDYLYGDTGNDRLEGQDARDYLYGGLGHDRLYGQDGDDYLYGGDGNDHLRGGNGTDRLYGENGHDYMDGDNDRDYIYGGLGNDKLYGGNGDDYLYGGDGNDQLFGESGTDRLKGDAGNDFLDGGRDGEKDYLDGGSGSDTGVQYSQRYRKKVWFKWRWRTRYQESLSSIENTETKEW
ncbi:MAG: calcium-binding protein, partial [Planctomycetota bacterium]